MIMAEKVTTAVPPSYDQSPTVLGQTMFSQPGAQPHGAYPAQPQDAYPMQPQFTGQPQVVNRGYPVQQQGYPAQQQSPVSPQQAYSPQQGFSPQQPFVQTQQGFVQPQQGTLQPQQTGMQPIGAPTQFHSASPLAALGQGSSPADCPMCRHRAMTITSSEVGNTTHAWAAILCFVFCLGCIPYLLTSTFDVKHKCGHCGVLLATWHRSGRTVVHAYG